MGTTAANFLPASTGQDLGSLTQRWDAFIQNLNISGSITGLGMPVNVMSYGAVGNGTTDDTVAIGLAIAACVAGGTLYFPPGTYLISSSLTPLKKLAFLGAGCLAPTGGMASIILKSAAMSTTAIDLTSEQGSSISALQIDGQTGNTGDGIRVRTNSVLIQNSLVIRQGGVGIRIGQDSGSYNSNSWVLSRVRVLSCGSHGVYVNSSSNDANLGIAFNVVCQSNVGDGIRSDQATLNLWAGPLCESNGGYGMNFLNTTANAGNGYNIVLGADLNELNTSGPLNDAGNGNAFLFDAVNSTATPPSTGLASTYLNNQLARFSALGGGEFNKLNLVGSTFTGGVWTAYKPSVSMLGSLFLHRGGDDSAQNVFLGNQSGNTSSTGDANTAVGRDSLFALTSGTNNVAIGTGALTALTTPTQNTGVGQNCLHAVTTGALNVGLGAAAGSTVTTGGNNTYLGSGTVASGVAVDHECAIGAGVTGSGSNTVTLGRTNESVVIPGLISKYKNIATVSNGVPSELATVDLTAQGAAITTATLYAPVADGQFRLNWNAQVEVVDGSSSTLGSLTVVYTSPDSVVHTLTCGAMTSAGAIATTSTTNTTAAVLLGVPLFLNCKSGTNITYAFAYVSNTPGQMKFNIHMKLESL